MRSLAMWTVLVAGTCLGTLGVPAMSSAQTGGLVAVDRAPGMAILSTSGRATVTRTPDTAEVSVGVVTTAKTSLDAQDLLNRQMDRVTNQVKAIALAGLTIQTQGLNLQPEFEPMHQSTPEKMPRIIGYRASITINIRTSEPKRVGAVVDAAINAGANQIYGISFFLKDDAEAQREAVANAAKDARAKVEAMAGAMGLKVVRILNATTNTSMARPMFQNMAMMAEAAPMRSVAATPVEIGESSVYAEVTLEVAATENKP